MVDIAKKIKASTAYAGLTDKAMAEAFGVAPPTYLSRLKNSKFGKADFEVFEKTLGCKINLTFEFPDGTVI